MSSIHAVTRLLAASVIGTAFACASAFAAKTYEEPKEVGESTVVFVCNYGSMKSLLAAARFNELAKERGLAVRAVSRSAYAQITHARVSDPIAEGMAKDGYDVASFKPKPLTREEATKAAYIVHVTQETLSKDVGTPTASHRKDVEHWEGIASGAKSYTAMRDGLLPRVDAFFETYTKKLQKDPSVAAR